MKLLIDLIAILRVNNTTVRSGKGNGISPLLVLLVTIGLDKGWNQITQSILMLHHSVLETTKAGNSFQQSFYLPSV
ncbi:hypothetical protein [Vibrio celticus]|uniref:hypothetical protein n=1 Tax=Vibrio celticus TaxID=446372 RepID=UPI00080FB5FF|nr:hypothetical protein [Vibrio celticus]